MEERKETPKRNDKLVRFEEVLRSINIISALILFLFFLIPSATNYQNEGFKPLVYYGIIFTVQIFLEVAVLSPLFKKINKSNVNAKIKGVFYSLHIVRIEWITLFAALIAYLTFLLKKDVSVQTFDKYNNVEFLLTAIGFLIVLIGQMKTFFDFNKDLYYFRSINDKNKELNLQEEVELTENHVDNGYTKTMYNSHGDKEYYIMSDKINDLLYNQNNETNLDNILTFKEIKYKFKIAEEIKKFVPFALKEKLESNKILFNGKLVGQLSNLYLPKNIDKQETDMKKTDIIINQTSYYDALSTNHIVYKNIYHLNHIDLRFDGSKMFYNKRNDEKKVILDFDESYLANHIGINTLALSNDGYVIIGLQGARSEVSAGKYINTGSGSLNYKDFKKFKVNKSLKDIIIYGTERELIEETGIPKTTKIKTDLIGYMQVLKYGGKPDYFSVSVIDLKAEDIINFAKNSKEYKEGLMGKPTIKGVGFNNIEENIIKEIIKLQEKPEKTTIKGKEEIIKTSVQLEVSKVIIRTHLKNGVRVFKNIMNKKEWD